MKLKLMLAGVATVLATAQAPAHAAARDYISIVGSSTVYPFATVVAERFGRASGGATPKIESTGSGGGMKLFCAGVGTDHPDITNASRRMKKSEFDLCQANGVKDVVEVVVGYDGIVLGNSVKSPKMNVTTRDVFLALAKDVPSPDGAEKLVPNPYKTWKQVNPALPDAEIEVLGPPPTSGTRDAFSELVMESGCKSFDWIAAIKKQDKKRFKAICHGVREDGAYVEAGENDNLIVQKLEKNPEAFGIFGFSFLDQNRNKIQGSTFDGVAPGFETISSGDYPVSRSLFFYVKKAHVGVVPGIEGYVREFTSDRAWGPEGYLADKGLIPLDENRRKQVAREARQLKPLSGSEL